MLSLLVFLELERMEGIDRSNEDRTHPYQTLVEAMYAWTDEALRR